MSMDSLERRLRAADPPLAPDPSFHDELYTTLIGELGFAAATDRPGPKPHGRLRGRPRRRWLMLLVAIVAVGGLGVAIGAGALLRRSEPLPPPTPTQALPAPPAPTAVVAAVPEGWATGVRGDAARRNAADQGPAGNPVVRWRFGAGDSLSAVPVVVGEVVYVAGETGVVHALNAADGTERWTARLTGSPHSAVVLGDLLYLADRDGVIHALEIGTGVQRWQSSRAIGASELLASDGALYGTTADGALVALDAASGAERWRFAPPGAGALHSPSTAVGLVYVSSETGGYFALDAATGTQRWHFDTGSDGTGTAVIADGIAYVGAGAGEPGRLYALDAATGELRWRVDENIYSPAVANGVDYSGSDTGLVTARDATTGRERWRFQVRGTARPPVVAGDLLLVPADDEHRIYALDAASGTEVWQVDVDGGMPNGFAVTGGVIYVGTTAGSVYAIGGDGASTLAAIPSVAPSAAPPAATASPAPSGVPADVPNPFAIASTLDPAKTGLVTPHAMAIGPDGIYVADLEPKIRVIAPDGSPIRSWGKAGSGPGEFSFADGVAAIAVGSNGLVYVADNGNHRVQVFKPDGSFVRAFGSFGSGPGQFLVVFAVLVDEQGSVYVVDDGQGTLTTFDPTGKPVWTIGGAAETDPDLRGHFHPGGFDHKGRLWLANDGAGRVVAIDHDGHKVDALGQPADFEVAPIGVALDAADNVYVWDCSATRMLVFDPQHQLIGRWTEPTGLPFGASYAFSAGGRLYALAGGDRCAGPPGTDPARIIVMNVATAPSPSRRPSASPSPS
jgi:outer membrane protein assembly factor BamB